MRFKNYRYQVLLFLCLVGVYLFFSCSAGNGKDNQVPEREFNGPYFGSYLNRVAFPIGGMGAGMFCLEGTGAISHVSFRNRPEIFHEPLIFAALCVKGGERGKNIARVIEGPIPQHKYFGKPGAGNGLGGTSYGLPRFGEAKFLARFPFGTVTLKDDEIPLEVKITGWSPFIPGDADNSSLPVGALEYTFQNPTSSKQEAVFSFNTVNFMAMSNTLRWSPQVQRGDGVLPFQNGFILWQEGTEEHPEYEGACAIYVDHMNAVVNHHWFRGGWWDPLTIAWKNIQEAKLVANPQVEGSVPGASLYVPFTLQPGEEKTIRLMIAWYVPETDLRYGQNGEDASQNEAQACSLPKTHIPWYADKFKSIETVARYWRNNYDDLRQKSALFRDTFYDMTLPDEVMEAVAANLTILKSPTVLRQTDGRLWCFEGCSDERGCCYGSCTHVWNYAQAIPHLFPQLERSLRHTEFHESQDETGH